MPAPTHTYHIRIGPHSYFATPSKVKGYRWDLTVPGGRSMVSFKSLWRLHAHLHNLHGWELGMRSWVMDDVDPDEPTEEEQNEEP